MDPLAFNYAFNANETTDVETGDALPATAEDVNVTLRYIELDESGQPVTTTPTTDNPNGYVYLDGGTVTEGTRVGVLVELDNPPTGSPLVLTLTNGGDNTAELTIPVGATSGFIELDVRADDDFTQADDVYDVAVTGASGGGYSAINIDQSTSVTVVDDSDATTITIGNVEYLEGTTGATVTATISVAPKEDLTITLSNGATITFAANSTEATSTAFTVPVTTHGEPGSATDSTSVLALTATVTSGGGEFENIAFANGQITITDGLPTARNDTAPTMQEDKPVTINVFGNDTAGADGVNLSTGVVLASEPSKGSVEYNADGTFTYTPTAGQEGADSFTYTITDADGDTSTATVNITLATDSVPTVDVVFVQGDDGIVNESGLVGGSAAGTGLTSSGTFPIDTGNDTLASLVVGGVNVTNGGTVTGASGTLVVTNTSGAYSWTYTLTSTTTDAANVAETDDFSVVVTDSDGDTASSTLSVSIADDTPSAANDSATPAEDTAVIINVFANDTAGADGVNLSTGVAVATNPTQGAVVYNGNGTFTYTPTAGKEGTDSFTYTITDADGDTSTATVNITLATDSVPTVDVVFVQGDDGIVNESGLVGGSAAGTGLTSSGTFPIDTGNDTLASLVVGGVNVTKGGTVTGASGTLVVTNTSGAYSWTYTLTSTTTDAANVAETDDFSVVVTDSDGDTASSTLSVSIADDTPSAANDSATPAEDTAVIINVFANDTAGADGVNLSTGVAVATNPTQGAVVYNGNGTFTYTPTAGKEGHRQLHLHDHRRRRRHVHRDGQHHAGHGLRANSRCGLCARR